MQIINFYPTKKKKKKKEPPSTCMSACSKASIYNFYFENLIYKCKKKFEN